MGVYGIVAEYNPFHNGHQYQIEQIKSRDPKAFIIVIMSGYFCQRGEAAILPPYSRAAMALSCGADIVFQLPTYAALGSAEIFAETAVISLAKSGICQYLAFGSESDSLEELQKIADLLITEERTLWEYIEPQLKEGISYAKSRENFVSEKLGISFSQLLKKPNQVLAIEYLKAIKKYNLNLKPILIKRQGSDYLQEGLSEDIFPSALAIREFLNKRKYNFLNVHDISYLQKFIPNKALAILLDDWQNEIYLKENNLNMIYSLILENTNQAKTRYLDQALLNRLKKALRFSDDHYPSMDVLIKSAMTKQYPKTRVQRALSNLILNIEEKPNFQPQYLHLLGFTKQGRYLLKRMQDKTNLPIVSNFSDISNVLDKKELWQENLELRASRFWLEIANQPINQIFDSPLRMR